MAKTQNAPAGTYGPHMDGASHEAMYKNFVHFTAVASVFVLCCVTALAVGGIKHAWLSAVFALVLAHIATAIGLFSQAISWRAPAVVFALLLVMLVFY